MGKRERQEHTAAGDMSALELGRGLKHACSRWFRIAKRDYEEDCWPEPMLLSFKERHSPQDPAMRSATA